MSRDPVMTRGHDRTGHGSQHRRCDPFDPVVVTRDRSRWNASGPLPLLVRETASRGNDRAARRAVDAPPPDARSGGLQATPPHGWAELGTFRRRHTPTRYPQGALDGYFAVAMRTA